MFTCLVAMGLTAYAFYAENWANFDSGSDDMEFGLWYLTDGADSDIGKSWDCWKVLWCEVSDEYSGVSANEKIADAWCDQSTAFKNAAMIYYCCNLVALVFLAKFIISLVCIFNEKDPGHKRWMYVCASMFTVLSAGGFAAWFALTGVWYENDCDDTDYSEDAIDGDKWKLCAGMGSTFAILACGFMVIAGILGIVHTMKLDEMAEVSMSEEEVPCCGMKMHTMFFFILLWACIICAMATIIVREWVNFENSADDYTGSLFAIDEVKSVQDGFTYKYENYGWDCIAIGDCDSDDDSTNCKTFEPLYEAGRMYFELELAVVGCLLVFNTFFFYAMMYKREWGMPMLNHALPHLAWMIHLAATVMWVLKSEVKFEMGDCDNGTVDKDEQMDVCIKTGPILMIVELFMLISLAGYFSFIYYRRGESSGGMTSPKASSGASKGKVGTLKSLPVKHPNVSPQLIVKDGKTALKLYADAFGGAIEDTMEEKGKLEYGEIKIGDSYLMVADEDKDWKSVNPTKLGNTSGEILMMVPKCDSIYERCLKLGFTMQLKPTDMPWGDRYARIVCPFGHVFAIN